MPRQAPNQSWVSTQPKNATVHPGAPDQVTKRKCHTREQIEADKNMAVEAKAAEEAKRMDGMKNIADLETKWHWRIHFIQWCYVVEGYK